jgi:hypothetical protein
VTLTTWLASQAFTQSSSTTISAGLGRSLPSITSKVNFFVGTLLQAVARAPAASASRVLARGFISVGSA